MVAEAQHLISRLRPLTPSRCLRFCRPRATPLSSAAGLERSTSSAMQDAELVQLIQARSMSFVSTLYEISAGGSAGDRMTAARCSEAKTVGRRRRMQDDTEDDGREVVRAIQPRWPQAWSHGRLAWRLADLMCDWRRVTRSCAKEPDPFDPLPACSPGMLTDSDGSAAGDDRQRTIRVDVSTGAGGRSRAIGWISRSGALRYLMLYSARTPTDGGRMSGRRSARRAAKSACLAGAEASSTIT